MGNNPKGIKYKFLENIATGDVAFEVYGKDLPDLFSNITQATCAAMADPKSVEKKEIRMVKISTQKIEDLIYDYISEIVYYKDAETLLFPSAEIKIKRVGKNFRLSAKLFGEKINPQKHKLKEDIKSVTYHNLKAVKTPTGWKSTVILDI
jgi:SHS2 domain-containing protein